MYPDYRQVQAAARAARAWALTGQPREGEKAREIVADLKVQLQADRSAVQRFATELETAEQYLASEAGAAAAEELLEEMAKRAYTASEHDWSKDA